MFSIIPLVTWSFRNNSNILICCSKNKQTKTIVKNLVSQIIRILEYYIWVSLNDHPYSINSGYLLFFETTIMGKTADLAMVQKTIIDTLHKEGKSQSLLKRQAFHRVLYQSILNAKVTEKKKLGRRRCTSNRDDGKLENTVKQSQCKHLG